MVPEGYPQWAKLYGPGPTGEMAAAKPTIQGGKEAGSITIASFERILRDAPETIHLIDVRAEKHFRAATIKGAINIPIDALEDSLDELPKGKPIVFFCTSGARSGDAYDMVKEKKLPIEAYFLDANVKFDKDGNKIENGISGTTNMIKVHMVGDSLLAGVGIGSHNAKGEVCVCRNATEAAKKFKPGQILVVPFTTNDTLPFMREAAGIITEEAGTNSHSAIVGLTLDKAVIVGATNATRTLKDGMTISMDCARGVVQAMAK